MTEREKVEAILKELKELRLIDPNINEKHYAAAIAIGLKSIGAITDVMQAI